MYLTDGFTATGTGELGAVRLPGARIGGNPECTGRRCTTTPAPPFSPTICRSTTTCSSTAGSPPPAPAARGAVRLPGAHIGGSLHCDGATLGNDSGPGLRAFRLQVDQDMYLTGGFTATGSNDRARSA